MRRIRNCVISPTAPPIDCICLYYGKAYYFNNGGWVAIGNKDMEDDGNNGNCECNTEGKHYIDLNEDEDIELLMDRLDPILQEEYPKYVLPEASNSKLGGVFKIPLIQYNNDRATLENIHKTQVQLLKALQKNKVIDELEDLDGAIAEPELEYEVILYKGPGIKSVSGAGLYYEGDTVTLDCEAEDGYVFEEWSCSDPKYNSKNITFKFKMPAKELEFDVIGTTDSTEVLEYEVTLEKTEGVKEVKGAGFYPSGSNVSVTCVLEDGYQFEGWFDGEYYNSNNPYKFTIYNENVHLKAVTSKKPVGPEVKYELNLKGDDGIEKTIGSGEYTANTIKEVSCVVKPSFQFIRWKNVDDSTYETSRTFNIRMPEERLMLFAETMEVPV